MSTFDCLGRMRTAALATIMAGLAAPLLAQTPPVPNVRITNRPDLPVNVWPADFNRDGRTDLVAGAGLGQAADLLVTLGRGDGTFPAPTSLGIPAIPLTVGDLNADGFTDILIRRGDAMQVLPGRGDGTFAAARGIAPTHAFIDEVRVWAYIVDLDGDGRRDIIVPEPMDTLKFYRGNGDFTFQAPVDLFTQGGGYQPAEATSGDLNGDGRRDLVVVSPGAIDIFLNRGGVTFARSTISMWPLSDITLRDMNNDNRLDLVVSSGRFENVPWADPGFVYLMFGNGDGTFQPRIEYPTGVLGTMSIVTGDFNGDGRVDVATGNRSTLFHDDLGPLYSDSVSVLPGDGTGRLLPATTFIVGPPNLNPYAWSGPYLGTHNQLNTSDLNGDGRTDLIASPGVVLLNLPAAPNRAPAVFAGADRTEFYYDFSLILRADGRDPDGHWLTYRWTDQDGNRISSFSAARVGDQPRGTTRTYTVTVDDGHGGVASDSVAVHIPNEGDPFIDIVRPVNEAGPIVAGVPYTVTWSVWQTAPVLTSMALSYSTDDGRTFQTVPGCGALAPQTGQCVWQNPGPVTDSLRLRLIGTTASGTFIALSPRLPLVASPVGWSSVDVGAVGAAGTTSFNGGTWTIEGSGADVWGTADEFRFVRQPVTGNATMVVRVASIENLDRWTKAGLMIRENDQPGARHVSLFATPRTDRGIAFQRRRTANGLSVHTSGPAVAPPGWLALGRIGDTISAYYRATATAPWTLVGRETLTGLPATVLFGMAVSSHVDGSLATAVFDNLFVDPAVLDSSADVGSVGVAGTTSFDGVLYEVNASGTDIWGTADTFRAVYNNAGALGGTREITARVRSVSATHAWAKAGVMFRNSPTNAGSPHVMVVVTPGKGVAMQYRPEYGAASVQVAVRSGTAPEWLRLTQIDGTYTGYASEDGVTWQRIGSITIPATYSQPVLAVTSHNNGALATAVFENVRLRTFVSQ